MDDDRGSDGGHLHKGRMQERGGGEVDEVGKKR